MLYPSHFLLTPTTSRMALFRGPSVSSDSAMEEDGEEPEADKRCHIMAMRSRKQHLSGSNDIAKCSLQLHSSAGSSASLAKNCWRIPPIVLDYPKGWVSLLRWPSGDPSWLLLAREHPIDSQPGPSTPSALYRRYWWSPTSLTTPSPCHRRRSSN